MKTTIGPVYLLFDQFEEIFILGNVDEQLKCIHNIKAILDANLPCKIILIMREEYIGRLYPYEQTLPSLFDHRFRVEPMGPLQIKDVVTNSFEKFNVKVEAPEDQSIQLILDNLSDSSNEIALPYLQVYLDILYREEYERTIGDEPLGDVYPLLPLTRDEIKEAGRIEDVLNKFLDEQELHIYGSLKEQYPGLEREQISAILDAFVTDDGTKKPISILRDENGISLSSKEALGFPKMDSSLLIAIFHHLQGSRLLHIGNNSIELAHDSLAALVDERRSEEQKLQNQLRKRLINSHDEYLNTGTFLSSRQLESFAEFLPSLSLSMEIEDFIQQSKDEVERKKQLEISNQRKQLEAEQEIKKAELTRQKLEAEKKAKRRLAIGSTIIALLLPVIAYMWYTANERGIEIESQKITVDSLLDVSKNDNLALSKINSELNYVKAILDTINQTGISGDSLYLLVSQAVSSIDALKEDKVIEEVDQSKTRLVAAITTDRRGSTTKKQTFKPGDIVYMYSYFHIPRQGDNITIKWLKPSGKVYHQKNKAMGYNWEDQGGLFWDAKGQLSETGEYKIQFYNGKKELIHELTFKVI